MSETNMKTSRFADASFACLIFSTGLLIALRFLVLRFEVMRINPLHSTLLMIRPFYFLFPLAGFMLAVIFGYIARAKIRNGRGRVVGAKKATTGIRLGWAGTVFTFVIFFAISLFSVTYSSIVSLRRNACLRNITALTEMCRTYAEDYGQFPLRVGVLHDAGYEEALMAGKCPGFAGNYGLYGLNTAADFDSPPDTPLLGDFDSINHNHAGGHIGYVDGTVKWHNGKYSAGSGPLENVSPEDWVRQ